MVITLSSEMTNPISDGIPQMMFMYGMSSCVGINTGVKKRLIIIAAIPLRPKIVVAISLSFGGNQLWLTLVTILTTIMAEKAYKT